MSGRLTDFKERDLFPDEFEADSEGCLMSPQTEQIEKDISAVREWLKDLDEKTDKILTQGCSHRGNDLDKITRIEKAGDIIRGEVSTVRNTVSTLQVALATHGKEMDNKISGLKIWALAQLFVLALGVLGFVVKEFVIPATKNQSVPYHLSPSEFNDFLKYIREHPESHKK